MTDLHVRRIAKAAWWLVTPWRLPDRLRFRRERARKAWRDAALLRMLERERVLVGQRLAGTLVDPAREVDWFDNRDVADASGLALEDILWSREQGAAIQTNWAAVRFCIDLLRTRRGVYEQFPTALSDGSDGAFSTWLRTVGVSELGLTAAGLEQIAAALASDVGGRARRVFLDNDELRRAMPHGLTPSGHRALFAWFMQFGREQEGLRLEEIWWLFLQAREQPALELARAYWFTPSWQEQFSDGMTHFGLNAFLTWCKEAYGMKEAWLNRESWKDFFAPPHEQLRSAYWARPGWRELHPGATQDVAAARAFIDWLRLPEAGLSAEAADWVSQLDAAAEAEQLAALGVNVVGHFCYPSGLRVSAESLVEAMRLAGVHTSLRDVRTDAGDEPRHLEFHGSECHDITVVHTQPEPFFDRAYARADLGAREPRTYRIAFWYWEFDSVPASWQTHAQDVDEVWTATEFVAGGLRERLSVPVRTLFPGVRLAPYERRSRTAFGLDSERFTFLFTFHMMSVMERKNPLGLIQAFKRAFTEDEPVTLVLKTSFGDRHPEEFATLQGAAVGRHIALIDEIYSPDEVLSLMDACDAYVSLHRSEGLGLTMAEAMLMGKPVIATKFSGNVDFMDDSNSLLVSYELVRLKEPVPPYDADLEWAEPSVEHAAQLMRRVYENQAWARELGQRAKLSAEANLSLEVAGQKIVNRLEEIRALQRSAQA